MNKPIDRLTIQRLLIRMGIMPKTNGYPYLATAIVYMLELRPAQPHVTAVYAEIAKEYGVTRASVERCMRFAVMRAYTATKLELINEMYNTVVITETPTLSDFLYYIVEYLDTFYQHDDFSFV